MPLEDGRYVGPLYRALNPVHAREPLSGHGAAIYGGRFNPLGVETLYTALDPATALREANQAGDLQPTILVPYRADLGPVIDARDIAALADHKMTPEALANPGWRSAMLEGQPVPTQAFARALFDTGYAGLLVRSFAQGTDDRNLNLVLWRWSGKGASLNGVDDENRLGYLQSGLMGQ